MNLDEWKAKHLQDNDDDVIPCDCPTYEEIRKVLAHLKPLTDMQIKRKWIGKKTTVGSLPEFMDGVRWAEKMHGIGEIK